MDIKYKAWLIKEQKMVVPSSINWNKGYGGALEIFVDNPDWSVEEITSGRKFNPKKPPFFTYINHVHEEHLKEKPHEFVLLQYTTLSFNGNEIYQGQILEHGNFYWEEGSSEDWFGTEPQVSWHVVEAYPERTKSIVEFHNGMFVLTSIYNPKKKIALHYVLDEKYWKDTLDWFKETCPEEWEINLEEHGTHEEQVKYLGNVEILGDIYQNPDLLK